MSRPEEEAPPRLVAWLYALVALGAGLYGAAFWTFRDRGPGPEAIAGASEKLRAAHRPGDLLLLVPHYATRAREHLGDLHPLAVRDPLAEDFERHARFFVLGLYGEAEDLRPRLVRAGHRLLDTVSEGGVVVDRFASAHTATIAFDFLAGLRRARVHHEYDDGRREPCDRWEDQNSQGGPGGRWVCPHDGEWFFVGREWHRMGDHLRDCLWAHPPSAGRLVITYPAVPLGGRLFGRGGHTLNSSVHARERVDLDVVAGSASQRFSFALTDYYRPFSLITEVGTATVSFAVSSPDAGANHFCFVADSRSP